MVDDDWMVILRSSCQWMGYFCQWMVILCFMSATLTLDSRVPLALSYLKTAQPISAIQNVSRLLVFISLQNVSRLLVSICHVFSRTICPTRSSYAKYPVQWMEHHRGVGRTALISVAIRGESVKQSAELKMIEALDQFDFYPEFDLLNWDWRNAEWWWIG